MEGILLFFRVVARLLRTIAASVTKACCGLMTVR
jgi:hypothetical protein